MMVPITRAKTSIPNQPGQHWHPDYLARKESPAGVMAALLHLQYDVFARLQTVWGWSDPVAKLLLAYPFMLIYKDERAALACTGKTRAENLCALQRFSASAFRDKAVFSEDLLFQVGDKSVKTRICVPAQFGECRGEVRDGKCPRGYHWCASPICQETEHYRSHTLRQECLLQGSRLRQFTKKQGDTTPDAAFRTPTYRRR